MRARHRVCPECGRRFTRYEIASGQRPWTPWRSLRRASGVLALRALVALPACFLLDMLLLPALSSPPYGVLLLMLAVAGLALGWWLGRGLVDFMGCKSLALTALAVAFGWATVGCAAALADLVWPVDGWTEVYALHTAAVFATLWILKSTALDD